MTEASAPIPTENGRILFKFGERPSIIIEPPGATEFLASSEIVEEMEQIAGLGPQLDAFGLAKPVVTRLSQGRYKIQHGKNTLVLELSDFSKDTDTYFCRIIYFE